MLNCHTGTFPLSVPFLSLSLSLSFSFSLALFVSLFLVLSISFFSVSQSLVLSILLFLSIANSMSCLSGLHGDVCPAVCVLCSPIRPFRPPPLPLPLPLSRYPRRHLNILQFNSSDRFLNFLSQKEQSHQNFLHVPRQIAHLMAYCNMHDMSFKTLWTVS
jgi:hypothetical protein